MTARPITADAVLMMSASAFFVLTAFVVHVLLARWLSPDLYGLWGVVISMLVLVESSLMGALATTAGKLVSENPGAAAGTARTTQKAQMVLSILTIGAALLAAPLVADLLGDQRLNTLLRLAFLDVPVLGNL